MSRSLHRYLAIAIALPLFLMAVSGALVEFETEIDRGINPGYWNVQPLAHRLSWDAMFAAVRAAYPTDPITSVRLPVVPGIAAEFGLKSGKSTTLDPYRGTVLGARRTSETFTAHLHQFHTHFLLGEWGSRIIGVVALLSIVLGITGVVLWWPQRRFRVRWSGPWRRINFDLHHVMGFIGFLPWLLLSATGAAITFEGFVRPALYGLTASHPTTSPVLKSTRPDSRAVTIDIESAIDACRRALPGADVVIVVVPSSASGVFTGLMRFPEDHTPGGRSRVAIDRYTAKPIWIENSRTTAAGTRLWNFNRPIHTGDIGGIPTRILANIFSLLFAVQIISGLLMLRRMRTRTP